MSDLDTVLATLNDEVPAMTDEAFEHGRARLRAAMTGRLTASDRPRRRLPVLVTAAASVLAISAAFLLVGDDEVAVDTPAELAEWAKGLADDPPRVGPGQYLYERIQSTTERDLADNPAFRVRSTSTGEQWIPADYRDDWRLKVGAEHVEFVKGTPEAASAEGLAAPAPAAPVDVTAKCGAYARSGTPNPCDGDGWGYTGSPAFYRGLTGAPQDLYRTLVERARAFGDEDGEQIFAVAVRLLQPNIPNDFKATLFEAMSRIPGLTIRDDAPTADGRTGIALRVAGDDATREQILDRTTGDLIQGRFTTEHREETGTVTYGVTDSTRTHPN
jgi:hypothetical protein